MGRSLTIPPEIIDVHMHCFTGCRHAATVDSGIEKLRRRGLRNIVVAGLVNTHLNSRAMWKLMPDYVDNRGDPNFNEVNDLLELARLSDQFILPFVDTRYLWGDVSAALHDYIRKGFRGIKGIYLPDEGNDIGVPGVPEIFGISQRQYHKREWEIFSFAQTHDLPVLYHMDSRQYGDVMLAILEDFPTLRINFAHLGIGRRTFAPILDRYPNVYTDFANLLPHMKSNPAGYRDFIMHYPDRVCFASDAFLYQVETALDYIDMVKELMLPAEIEGQVFYGNPARFLGCALYDCTGGSSESGQRMSKCHV
jgi:hypothetical protein